MRAKIASYTSADAPAIGMKDGLSEGAISGSSAAGSCTFGRALQELLDAGNRHDGSGTYHLSNFKSDMSTGFVSGI
jgi:hypothetical protein